MAQHQYYAITYHSQKTEYARNGMRLIKPDFYIVSGPHSRRLNAEEAGHAAIECKRITYGYEQTEHRNLTVVGKSMLRRFVRFNEEE